jgi:hypothetical protein
MQPIFFSLKIVPFVRQSRKIWRSQTGRRWQYDAALHAGLVRLHAPLHPPPPHTHTHTEICNIYCFPTATITSWIAPQCYVIRTLPLVLDVTMLIKLKYHLLPNKILCIISMIMLLLLLTVDPKLLNPPKISSQSIKPKSTVWLSRKLGICHLCTAVLSYSVLFPLTSIYLHS